MTLATKEQLKEKFGDFDCECDSCGFRTEELHVSKSLAESIPGLREFLFCTICYSTFAGNAHRYPSQYPEANMMIMQAFCTNTILKAIKDSAL